VVEAMTTYSTRRWRNITLALITGLALLSVLSVQSQALRHTEFTSGWILFWSVLFLAAYNLRKKLTYPPLFASSTWLQLHLYVGWLSVFLFILHTKWRWPTGSLETLLWSAFAIVAGSGIVGLCLTRSIPRRLTSCREEVLFERIPIFRRRLRDEAEQLVLRSIEIGDQTILADFYQKELKDYFFYPRDLALHLLGSRWALNKRLHQLESLHRYLNKEELVLADELADLIDAKNDLDIQYALQGLLKVWFFVHIPMTYILIMLASVHAVVALAFRGDVL
jgi:hypothetical protein